MTMRRSSFGKKSTAADVVRGKSLAGLRVVVTGASSGIGVETVRALAGAGASCTLAVRDVAAGQRVASTLPGSHDVRALDLTDFASIRAFAAATTDSIDVLLCNAGVMATPLSFTKQGFEMQMGTNHVGHFLLVDALRARLAPTARVVVVASRAHRRGSGAGVVATLDDDPRYARRRYQPYVAYGDSKLANILFARALAKRLPAGQSAVSLHPGVIATNLTRHIGPAAVLWKLFGPLLFKNVEQGAATSVFAAIAPDLPSGIYLDDCNEGTTTADGRDDALAERVWALTAQRIAEAG